MKTGIPYGDKMVYLEIPEKNFIGLLDPPEILPAEEPELVLKEAIEHPVGGRKLEEILEPGKKVAVIVDDGSRPTPVAMILPVLLEKIHACGVKKQDVKIVIALGSHRYMTEAEIQERVGSRIYDSYCVVNSEFRKPEELVYICDSQEGAPLFATKAIMDADIRIGVGNLVPHPVMGWGGGGKIIFPGVAGEDTVSYFHLKASLYDDNMFGWSTTPVRDMMEGWVKLIGLDFIINTILTPGLKIYKAVAGDYIKAHREGVKIGKRALGCKVTEKADVVIASSHPADQDFWQSPKAIYGAEPALKGERGGTVILVSPNFEGVGPHPEYPEFMGRDDGDEIVKKCIAGKNTYGDPLAIAVGNSMSKMRRRRRLVVVGDGVTREEMERCGCIHYPLSELQKAVDDAIAEYENCRVAVLSGGAEAFLYEEGE